MLGNKSVLVSKSPIFTNYTMGNAGMGGQFPSEMKFAGYDHIAVTGKSETPVYLFVNNDEVEIREVWDPPWTTDRITDTGRALLRSVGVGIA